MNPQKHLNKLLFWLLLGWLMFTSGCWDAKDLANLAIVSAVGIDLDEKQPDQILVTVQIIKSGEVKSGAGGGDSGGGGSSNTSMGGRKAYLMVSSSGKTVPEAFRNMANQVNREIYLSHNQFIVFSKETAQKGLLPILDYFIRTRQTRETIWILISESKASEVLESTLGLEKIPANEINWLVINQEMASQASRATLAGFITKMMSKASASYSSLIRVIGNSVGKKILLTGMAVFKGDRYVGEFDKTETRGFLWVTNQVKRCNITIKSATGMGNINVGILRASSKMIPDVRLGKVNIRLTINVEYGLTGDATLEDYTNLNHTKSLEVLVERAIRREVGFALKKAFQLDADVFGFGEAVHRKFPKEWKMMKPVWDQQFLTTRIIIKINTRLRSVGLSVKPLSPK